ncbi:MAG: lecithin retinol acyltransferase family protein [Pseudomonadales bacterium]|nr:lecithin retinol acyltransferase family protein [Pseudomonadales bacterium]
MTGEHLPGDVVSRRKGLVLHKGVILEDGCILHNTPLRGEHISTREEFARGHRVSVVNMSAEEREAALEHANNFHHEARNYHLLRNNCEHTVTRATTGSARSPQLTGWVFGAGLAVMALLVTRRPGIAVAGYMLGRRIAQRINA